MKPNHTKGPWTFIHGNLSNGMENDHFAGDIRLTDDLQWSIAAVWNDCGEKEEVEANALLIAASPDLLKAAISCQIMADRCNNAMLPDSVQELLKAIETTLSNAIKKALPV